MARFFRKGCLERMVSSVLNKICGVKVDDEKRFQRLQRRMEDIVRSRSAKIRDEKNEELIDFCRGCGLRRKVLEKLKGSDLYERSRVEAVLEKARAEGDQPMVKACTDALMTFPDKEYFILHKDDDISETRISPIVGPNTDMIVKRMKNAKPDELVWGYVPGNCDVHRYRVDYVTYLYREYARPEDRQSFKNQIKCADGKYRTEVYTCRVNGKEKRLDRNAIRVINIALGHNREDTIITNYVRNL